MVPVKLMINFGQIGIQTVSLSVFSKFLFCCFIYFLFIQSLFSSAALPLPNTHIFTMITFVIQ